MRDHKIVHLKYRCVQKRMLTDSGCDSIDVPATIHARPGLSRSGPDRGSVPTGCGPPLSDTKMTAPVIVCTLNRISLFDVYVSAGAQLPNRDYTLGRSVRPGYGILSNSIRKSENQRIKSRPMSAPSRFTYHAAKASRLVVLDISNRTCLSASHLQQREIQRNRDKLARKKSKFQL